MKHRASYVLLLICLMLLLSVGVGELLFTSREERISASENRVLQPMPELSPKTIFSGSFMADFESWLSDAFVARDFSSTVSEKLQGVFSLPEEESAIVEIDESTLFETTEEDSAALAWLEENSKPASEAEDAETAANAPAANAPTAQAEAAEFWLINAAGNRETALSYTAEEMSVVADVLNTYLEYLPEDGTVNLLNAPSAEYALKITHGSYTGWGSTVEDSLEPATADRVHIYDLTDILTPWLGVEDLYPTTDHHWLAFSTSLAAAAMLEKQGVPATTYYDYRYYLASHFGGVAYGEEAFASMTVSEDDFRVLQPVTPVESYVVYHLTELRKSVFITTNEAGYRQYLGGTYGPWRLFRTGYNTGRTALVIGDSFSNCFIPYITPYYDQILSTDLRDTKYIAADAGASIAEYMEYYGVDDVYIITCTYTPLNGSMFQKRLLQYLQVNYGG